MPHLNCAHGSYKHLEIYNEKEKVHETETFFRQNLKFKSIIYASNSHVNSIAIALYWLLFFNSIKSFGIEMNPVNQIANWRTCHSDMYMCIRCACLWLGESYERNRTLPTIHKYMNRSDNLIYIQNSHMLYTRYYYVAFACTHYKMKIPLRCTRTHMHTYSQPVWINQNETGSLWAVCYVVKQECKSQQIYINKTKTHTSLVLYCIVSRVFCSACTARAQYLERFFIWLMLLFFSFAAIERTKCMWREKMMSFS